jgi:hypothetical protein
MKASTFWKTVVADKSEFLERIISLLEENDIRYCVIGGPAYAEPVVSLDLDLAIALEQIPEAEEALRAAFRVEKLPFSPKVSDAGSQLRVQIQTDPRYAEFVARASIKDVLGLELNVANVADVLQGKVCAASDETRPTSKRLKDYADIARILEGYPHLREGVPPEILQRLA